MSLYFRTRHTWVVLLGAIAVNAVLLLLARPLVIHHDAAVITFTGATPLQILAAGVLALGLSGRSEQFEFAGTRPLALLRLVNAALLTGVGAGAAGAVSYIGWVSGQEAVTVGPYAPLRAFLGLFGVTLIVTAFVDMRLGAVVALPLVFFPAAIDTGDTAFGSSTGFVLAPDDAMSWTAAILLLLIGVAAYASAYSERTSPSVNRRALLDSRTRSHIRRYSSRR